MPPHPEKMSAPRRTPFFLDLRGHLERVSQALSLFEAESNLMLDGETGDFAVMALDTSTPICSLYGGS